MQYLYIHTMGFVGFEICAKEVAKKYMLFQQALQNVLVICVKIDRPKEQMIVSGPKGKRSHKTVERANDRIRPSVQEK